MMPEADVELHTIGHNLYLPLLSYRVVHMTGCIECFIPFTLHLFICVKLGCV